MQGLFPKIRAEVQAFPAVQGGKEVIILQDRLGISPSLVVGKDAGPLLALLDGKNDLRDIQVFLMRRAGLGLIPMDELMNFIKTLDEHYFLENERYRAYKEQITKFFRSSPRRPPAHAGSAYPAGPEELKSFLKDLMDRASQVSCSSVGGPLSGLVLPHIDLYRGGLAYAAGYRALAPTLEGKSLFIVLGTCHLPTVHPWVLTSKIFETPLGDIPVAGELVERFCQLAGGDFLQDELVHRSEHTIEIQLVFLKYLMPKSAFKILPVLCSGYTELMEKRLLPSSNEALFKGIEALKMILREQDEGTCVIASADLAHLGPQFGDPRPLEPSDLVRFRREDLAMLEWALKGSADGFYRHIMAEGDRRRICGLPPIYAWLRLMEGKEIRLIHYDQAYHPHCTVTFASLGAW